MNFDKLRRQLAFLGQDLLDEILESAVFMNIDEGQEVLHYNQYVKVIPIVLSGSIKVFTSHESKELLLYYVRENESCIMTFMAIMNNEPSKVIARAMMDTELMLLPLDKIEGWLRTFPRFNMLFFRLFNSRFLDLLSTVNHLLFDPLDTRILKYLTEETEFIASSSISITHKRIAQELGTSREVVSRILKKLEQEGTISMDKSGIVIL